MLRLTSANEPAPLALCLPARKRLAVKAVIVLVPLAFTVTVSIGTSRGAIGAVTATSAPTPSGHPSEVGTGVYANVANAVRAAGLYRLEVGDRVADAIARAGGFAGDAVRDGVNITRVIANGEQVVVLVVGSPVETGAPGGFVSTASSGPLDPRMTTRGQLYELPRIGAALAGSHPCTRALASTLLFAGV